MRLSERVRAIEAKRSASLPQLPALVLMPSDDEAARRRQFLEQHGRAPELVIAVHRASARKDTNDAE
ncbi:MAG: hypothetical protein IPN21_14675 [Burkholderiales bacterium]|nr:hypothetical protein [Burkholderiales bacterium]